MLKVEEEVCRSLAKVNTSFNHRSTGNISKQHGLKVDRSYQTINHSILYSQLNMSRDQRDCLNQNNSMTLQSAKQPLPVHNSYNSGGFNPNQSYISNQHQHIIGNQPRSTRNTIKYNTGMLQGGTTCSSLNQQDTHQSIVLQDLSNGQRRNISPISKPPMNPNDLSTNSSFIVVNQSQHWA